MSTPVILSLLETLFERLRQQEDLELEYKAARGGLPQDPWPTVSAFANTHGGWIVLGVTEEEDGTFTTVGVANPGKLLQDFHNLLRNTQKINYPVCGANDTSIEHLGDKQVLVLRVPAAPRKVRPMYIAGNPYTDTYLRRNSGDFRCSKPEVDRMMREASDITADSAILARFTWDDIDRDALARYRRRFQTQDPASPWNGYDDQRFLQAVGGYSHNRETGEEGITVAGLLLVGTSEALRDWRTRHLIDYRLVPGDIDPDTRWDDRVPWEGNLFSAFETIYPKLTAGQPVPFKLKDATRVDESAVHIALREALVNLLVHADYAETQTSLIVRSAEGYVFRNPGSSRIPVHDLLLGDRSDPRNPALVRMFRLIGLADEAGTGMPKIISAWRNLGFRLPRIDVGTERYEFTLRLRHAHLLMEEDRVWLRSLGENWTEPEQLALVIAKHEGDIDNPRLRSLTGQHPADVTKVLVSLRDRGLLQMTGFGRNTRYLLGPVTEKHQDTVSVRQGSAGSDVRSPSSEANPLSLPPSFGGLGKNLEDLKANSQDVWTELYDIARISREQRHLSAEARDDLIVQLCGLAALSVRELAQLIGRSDAHIRESLRALIASGRIFFFYTPSTEPSAPKICSQRAS